MTSVPPPRGRRPVITLARIAQAGTEMTLPHITFTGVAARLGVSHVALYKYVANLDELKQVVADAIFNQWHMPAPCTDDTGSLSDYLAVFARSLRQLVHQNPGLAGYLARHDQKTPAMLARILDHHAQIASAYAIPTETAGWLLSTVAYHCIALADTVYARPADTAAPLPHTAPASAAAQDAAFALSMQALIIGALQLATQQDGRPRAPSAQAPLVN